MYLHVYSIFFIFTNRTRDGIISLVCQVQLNDEKDLRAIWRENKPLKIITHGWQNLDDSFIDNIKNGNYIFFKNYSDNFCISAVWC